MLVSGIDENGLGPQLGPLIATASTIEVAKYDAKRLRAIGLKLGIADSKASSGFGKMRGAESLALAVAEHQSGRVPRDVDELTNTLSLDNPTTLRAPCPSRRTAKQCFGAELTLPAYGGDVEVGRTMLRKLDESGVRLRRARTVIRCAGVLNAGFAEGVNKLRQDLAMFERLALDAREALERDHEIICGMIGGIRKYPNYMTQFADRSKLIEEVRGASRYQVRGVGRVSFEVDSDDGHLPVALASMVGKYFRELTMERLVRFYREHDDTLPKASGYHDKVTKRFVSGTRETRRRLKIVDACFRRAG